MPGRRHHGRRLGNRRHISSAAAALSKDPRSTSMTLRSTANSPLQPNIHILSEAAALAFSPDGARLYLLSAGADQVVVFDTSTWEVIAAYPVGADATHQLDRSRAGSTMQVSPDGRFITVITADGIQLIDLSLAVSVATPGDDNLQGPGTLHGFGGNDVLTPPNPMRCSTETGTTTPTTSPPTTSMSTSMPAKANDTVQCEHRLLYTAGERRRLGSVLALGGHCGHRRLRQRARQCRPM